MGNQSCSFQIKNFNTFIKHNFFIYIKTKKISAFFIITHIIFVQIILTSTKNAHQSPRQQNSPSTEVISLKLSAWKIVFSFFLPSTVIVVMQQKLFTSQDLVQTVFGSEESRQPDFGASSIQNPKWHLSFLCMTISLPTTSFTRVVCNETVAKRGSATAEICQFVVVFESLK